MTKADEKLSAEVRDANILLMAYLLNAFKKKGDTQRQWIAKMEIGRVAKHGKY